LKRCICGTYVSVEPFHLFCYLDEEAFRFNERKHDDEIVKLDSEWFVNVASGIAGKRLTHVPIVRRKVTSVWTSAEVTQILRPGTSARSIR
jgi:hypothetical protein